MAKIIQNTATVFKFVEHISMFQTSSSAIQGIILIAMNNELNWTDTWNKRQTSLKYLVDIFKARKNSCWRR